MGKLFGVEEKGSEKGGKPEDQAVNPLPMGLEFSLIPKGESMDPSAKTKNKNRPVI